MAFPDGPIQDQGDGGGRSVGVAIDGEDGLLPGHLETLSDRVNDAQVGLVGDEPSMAVAFVFVTSRISSTAWPRRWTAFLYQYCGRFDHGTGYSIQNRAYHSDGRLEKHGQRHTRS